MAYEYAKVSNSGPKLMQATRPVRPVRWQRAAASWQAIRSPRQRRSPEYLSDKMFAAGGVFMQMEDELASINAVIGASWAARVP